MWRWLSVLSPLWDAAKRAKEAWEWWTILAAVGIVSAIQVIFGFLEGQPVSVVLLYVMMAIAFWVVLLAEGGPIIRSAIERRRNAPARRRRELRDALAGFTLKAKNEIMPMMGIGPFDKLVEALNTWDRHIEEFLANQPELGAAFIARFRTGAGIPPIPVPKLLIMHESQWHHLQTRLARLAEFMKELTQ